ncbi:zwei Ig domain protein zig-8-like isoform X2 [Phymastichus coffea]|uniref:zwei Ig domain protein zig-8-like isoform X2 n=1 Tax=Phymastichus coffea TaxID=108790 RepID=UPI00273B299C|nr:zwei Ig domain protein zig-8-like isoform X2 [Phymastichus coffea]
MTRTKLIFILGLAYLLRAESSLPDAPPDHQKPAGGGLINGVSGKPREDTSSGGSKPRTTSTSSGTSKTHFADEGSENVTGLVGQPAVLLCRVKNLGNRTVSWIRKRDLHILTSMALTYTSDERFSVIGNTETSDDWNLRIDYVQPRDEGIYECQVNTEPKIHRAVYLRVLDVQAEILGPEEVYVRKGSTISLTCMVNSQGVPPSNVTWYHAGYVIDFDGPRGGVSLETEKSKGGTTSKLLITRASLADSGNYSCVSSKAARATVVVHVLNGEHPAAMQHGTAVSGSTPRLLLTLVLLLLLALMSR